MVMKAHLNWQCLFCILIAHITSANDLFQICLRAKKIAEARKESAASDEPADDIGPQAIDSMDWMLAFVWCAALLCFLVQLHSFGKLVGAFICEEPRRVVRPVVSDTAPSVSADAIWNFPDRCVDVDANWRSSPGG
eukprot:g28199.t1